LPTGPDSLSGTAVQFKLTNQSAFGYRDANFYVGMVQGDALLALLPLQIKDFQGGETRVVDLRSYVPNLYGTGVKIYPLINIYNAGAYLPPSQ